MIRVAQMMGYMNGGGVESVVMNYYRNINHLNVQFDFIVCEGSQRVPVDEISDLGGRLFMVPPYKHLFEFQVEVRRLCLQNSWSIIHSHMNSLSVFPLGAAKSAGVPVRIAHSHTSTGRGDYFKSALKNVLKTQINRFPTHRVTCSKVAGDWLFGTGSDYKVIRNAIDVDSFAGGSNARSRVRVELGIRDDQLVIGHVGRFVTVKNHRFLLEVFKSVLESNPEAVLVLVGDGSLLNSMMDLAVKMGIGESVLFLGNRGNVFELYAAFDLFCLPSLYEGFPMVGIECQASGTPILASDAITREASVTSLMEFESLRTDPCIWARHLLEMRGRTLTCEDRINLEDFDAKRAAKVLEDYYFECLEGVVCP